MIKVNTQVADEATETQRRALAATGADGNGDGAASEGGTYFAAWLATKFTLPIRIAATLVLTPIVAAVIHKVQGKPKAKADDPTDDSESESAPESAES